MNWQIRKKHEAELEALRAKRLARLGADMSALDEPQARKRDGKGRAERPP